MWRLRQNCSQQPRFCFCFVFSFRVVCFQRAVVEGRSLRGHVWFQGLVVSWCRGGCHQSQDPAASEGPQSPVQVGDVEANGGPQPRFSFPEHTPPRCPCQGNTGPAGAGVAWVPDGRPGLTGGRRVAPSLTPLWKVKPGAGRRWRCRCRARAVTKSVPHWLIAPQGLSPSTVHSSGSRCRRLGLTRSAVGTAVPLHPEG